ncbi:MAG: SH3 domain-containing protein [Bacilli bacterium]|nr:SH3 domain-containing protein [Bacilli bacterium]
MRGKKKIISKIINPIFFVFSMFIFLFLGMTTVSAYIVNVDLTVNIRSGPGTSYSVLGQVSSGSYEASGTTATNDGTTLCSTRTWYKITYNGSTAYACSYNLSSVNKYDKPWTTPKKSILGGALFKSSDYVTLGQYTSYLIKFNVNPNSAYSVYTHQYMTNVRAVSFEATTSFNAYLENNLLNYPLTFTIPLYTGMPAEASPYPGSTSNITGQDIVTDTDFEAKLDVQGFPESYKKKLRLLHNAYPNWIFESLQTGLDWTASVSAEHPNSYVDGTDLALREIPNVLREYPAWYQANRQTVEYYMDPRNFLYDGKILMFEKLAYSDFYTEAIVQSSLTGTFMAGTSTLDSQTYASIFVEAGKAANISPIYLVSQAIQEVGVTGSMATTGEQFTYNGVTYKGLYNFFNIGAYSSATSPVRAGLVWANGGATSTIVTGDSTTTTEEQYLNTLGLRKTNGFVTGVPFGITVNSITDKITDTNVTATVTNAAGETLSDEAKITTGSRVTITNSTDTYTNTIVIYGDINGDGGINAIDLLYMRKHLSNIQLLTGFNLQAAKIAKNADASAVDLLYLRRFLMDSNTYKITQ